jgi:hypothetical protein
VAPRPAAIVPSRASARATPTVPSPISATFGLGLHAPGLQENGTVLVNMMSGTVRLFDHPVLFQSELEYQTYAQLLASALPKLRVIGAENRPGVAPDLGAWSLWFTRTRHPGWGLANHVLSEAHYELTGQRLPRQKIAAPPRGKTVQLATKVKQIHHPSPTAVKTEEKKVKNPDDGLSRKRQGYSLWVGECLLNTSPVSLTPEDVTRLLVLLKRCVRPPDTDIQATPDKAKPAGARFKRATLYQWCRKARQFDLPRLAGYLELAPPRENTEATATLKKKTGAITSVVKQKSPVWPGQHPRPHEWATSDQIEFNPFEYK